jgi:hypothetical protein
VELTTKEELVHDELADVDLRGKELVSDDPSTWIVPPGMAQHDSVLDWWKRLIKVETGLHPEVVHACQGAVAAWATQRGWYKERTIGFVNTLLSHGFTMKQVEDATSIPMRELFGPTLWSRWERIQAGDPLEDVIKGISTHWQKHVKLWDNIRQGIPKQANYARRNPKMKQAALDLWDQGVDRRTICVRLKEMFGEDIRPDTVSQWVLRRKQKLQKAS